MKPFDPTKPVQTRSGHKARIICTDRASKNRPIVALVTNSSGYEVMEAYTAEGRSLALGGNALRDLVNVPLQYEGWVNLFRDASGKPFVDETVYATESEAIRAADEESYLITTHIQWEE